jgi:hypothetical protein
MPNSRCDVVGNDDMWMIQYKDAENGGYNGGREAVLFAIAAAQHLGMRGERAHVCVLDSDGRFQSRRAYDRDRHQLTRASAIEQFADPVVFERAPEKFPAAGLTGETFSISISGE